MLSNTISRFPVFAARTDQGPSFFSPFSKKPDLKSAYLISIHKGNKWLTALITTRSHYEHLVMPYTLSNSLDSLSQGAFQVFIKKVLKVIVDRWGYHLCCQYSNLLQFLTVAYQKCLSGSWYWKCVPIKHIQKVLFSYSLWIIIVCFIFTFAAFPIFSPSSYSERKA